MTDTLPPIDWPNRSHSRIVSLAPHRWHVQSMGHGPSALFLHGAGASGHSWSALIDQEQIRTRAIVPDLPGHGFTRSPKGRARLPDVAGDIAALLAHEEVQPEMIVAHSAGAAVALEMIRRGLASPERLVIINGALEDFRGAAGWLFPILAKALALNPLTGFFLTSGKGSVSQVRSLIRSTGSTLSDEALQPYAQLFARKAHVDGTLDMMSQWSLGEVNGALPRIETPTLFIHGADDKAVAVSVAERACAAMPNARLRVLEGVGHIAHEEAPDRVAAEIALFVEDTPGT